VVPEPQVCVRLRILGRVQGVWYRASTQREALRLGVAGTVRNLPDGSVEAIVQGPQDAVDALVAWCRRGPPRAEVEQVIVSQAEVDRSLHTFVVG
jgi:acylphosphatase